MIANKRRYDTGAACPNGVCRIGIPDSDVGHLDWHISKDESFGTEDTSEVCNTATTTVGLNLALVPCQTERSGRTLHDEGSKWSIRGKAEHLNVHLLNRS